MHRVDKLADRKDGLRPEGAPGFHSIIPLPEIIAETLKVGVSSKKVSNAYIDLLSKLGSEFNILMDVPLDDIKMASSPVFREAISRMRTGNIQIKPGYDGEFGKVRIFEEVERKEIKERPAISAPEL